MHAVFRGNSVRQQNHLVRFMSRSLLELKYHGCAFTEVYTNVMGQKNVNIAFSSYEGNKVLSPGKTINIYWTSPSPPGHRPSVWFRGPHTSLFEMTRLTYNSLQIITRVVLQRTSDETSRQSLNNTVCVRRVCARVCVCAYTPGTG